MAYGLALQGLSRGVLRTNLIPKEIVKDRIIREKKPWAVAAAAMLLMGMTLSFVSASKVLGTVDESRFGQAEQAAAQGHFDEQGGSSRARSRGRSTRSRRPAAIF